ncbi:MAG: hypothetical protein F6J93_00960 [Oscillatoria sp. SIO1A7]|nr:hypothetical protein [Oscillatoria sp. SIO1A7]
MSRKIIRYISNYPLPAFDRAIAPYPCRECRELIITPKSSPFPKSSPTPYTLHPNS